MEENIRLNELDNCKAAALTWGDNPAPFNPPFDIILLADVVRPQSTQLSQSQDLGKLFLTRSFAFLLQITEMYSAHYPKLVQTLKDMSNDDTRIILGFGSFGAHKDRFKFECEPTCPWSLSLLSPSLLSY